MAWCPKLLDEANQQGSPEWKQSSLPGRNSAAECLFTLADPGADVERPGRPRVVLDRCDHEGANAADQRRWDVDSDVARNASR